MITEKLYTKEKSEYLENNPTWHIEDSPFKAQQILRILRQNNIVPNSIVEVGCGAGEILNQLYAALPDHVSFTGYDISIDAIKLAQQREKERLQFKHEDFLQADTVYDVLLLIDVFEHVDDYRGFLRACKNRANYTIFHIPLDISVHYILRNKLMLKRKNVGHLHFFTKDTALATLTDSGYEIIDFFYTKDSIELPRKTMKSKLAVLPRKLLYKANKDMAAKLLGGFSLLVLAK